MTATPGSRKGGGVGPVTIVVEPEINLENHAGLPRGIDNVREHIATVDNVPLLVSLFTDCTPDSIQEMVKLLKKNDGNSKWNVT